MNNQARYLLHSIFAAAAAMCIYHSSYAEPNNIGQLHSEVIAYHDTGLYQQELSKILMQAHAFMIKTAETNQKAAHPKPLALVLDIDETSLSNYDNMVKRNFIANMPKIHQEISKADAPVIQETLSLYQDALKYNIKVFFVTGRPRAELEATQTNLIRAGYHDWAAIMTRPDDYHESSIVPFKSQARAQITQQGYTVVATIGDQLSDIQGGYALRGFKLPNPYYYLP